MVRKRKIIVYIAASADGFIARTDGSVDWLDRPRPKGNYGMGAFYKSIDTILWGRKTCDMALDFQKKGIAGSAFDTKVKNYVFTRSQPQAVQQNGAVKPVATHTGWIIQVGALESESGARQRIEVARDQAHGLLSKADSFTEPVVAKGDRKLYRARFGLIAEALRDFLLHGSELIRAFFAAKARPAFDAGRIVFRLKKTSHRLAIRTAVSIQSKRKRRLPPG